MSAVTRLLSDRRPDATGQRAPLRAPTGRRDRRRLVLVGSVSLVAACIASFVALYSTADRKVPALVTVRAVPEGRQLTPADLGIAQVAVSPGVAYLPVDEFPSVSGKRAATAIPVGTLVTPADLTSAPAIPTGDAVVGVALKDGAYPTDGLAPGDQVLVVQTAAPGASVGTSAGGGSALTGSGALAGAGTASGDAGTVSGSGPVGTDPSVLVPMATVSASSVPATSSTGGITLLVSIVVPATVAARVVTAAAAGQVGLVLLPHVAMTSASVAPTGGNR